MALDYKSEIQSVIALLDRHVCKSNLIRPMHYYSLKAFAEMLIDNDETSIEYAKLFFQSEDFKSSRLTDFTYINMGLKVCAWYNLEEEATKIWEMIVNDDTKKRTLKVVKLYIEAPQFVNKMVSRSENLNKEIDE
eukprot:TRINITY_DN988_c0_g1_i7.p1 TRINITY_DN988_c0_g1~~TRINITY_DN988_c0_g1_i7.p1  ORF type:complete len:135 (+),score=28.26 TRINITY_DN988_c0_g1_i7:79-483(+)